jgi:hypothetical protein
MERMNVDEVAHSRWQVWYHGSPRAIAVSFGQLDDGRWYAAWVELSAVAQEPAWVFPAGDEGRAAALERAERWMTETGGAWEAS